MFCLEKKPFLSFEDIASPPCSASVGTGDDLHVHLELADSKAFLPAVCCCSFKPTFILCAPAELAAGKGWVSFGGIGKTFGERTCLLFPCASARSLCKKGNLFYCHFLALPFFLPQPWQRRWQEGNEGSFVLELFQTSITCFCRVFFCVLKPTHESFQNEIPVGNQPFELLGQSFPSRTVPFSGHTDCSGAFWGPLETAFRWLEPLPAWLQGQRTQMGGEYGVEWAVHCCPTWWFLTWLCKTDLAVFTSVQSRVKVTAWRVLLGGRWQSLCCEVVANVSNLVIVCAVSKMEGWKKILSGQ